MRGHVDPQSGLFRYFSVEERVSSDHPRRRTKTPADSVLDSLALFLTMYTWQG
jgi:hypothetical protein